MNSVKENFIFNLAYQILTLITPLITTPYLSRVLGAERTGVYSYSYSIAYYFVIFAMLGLNNYGNREIAKARDNTTDRSKTFWSIYCIQLFTATVAVMGYCIYAALVDSSVITWIMLLFVISAVFDINWFFWGMEEFKLTVIRNTIIKIATVICILMFVNSQNDLLVYAMIMVCGILISQIALWPYLRTRIVFYRPTIKDIIKHFKPNLILFIPVVAVSLYKVMDKIMLGSLASYVEVGYYDYSERVIAIPICVVNALGAVMLPRMANLVAKNEVEVEEKTIHKSLIFGTAMACAMSMGLMAIADTFVPFFYGAGFSKCVVLFYILLPSCVFLAVANVIRTQYLIPHSMDKQYTASLVLGAIINLSVNALFIPHYQSIGAAIGTLIAEGSVCAVQFNSVKHFLPLKKYLVDIAYIITSGTVMFFVVYNIPAVGTTIVSLIIKIIIGVIIYFALMILRYRSMIISMVKKG